MDIADAFPDGPEGDLDDLEEEFGDEVFDEVVRAKWTMDGASTLEEAAVRLESFAAWLRAAHAAGFVLTHPVEDDYGFVTHPDGLTLDVVAGSGGGAG